MPSRSNPPLPSKSRLDSRALRASLTDAETRLWFHLRAGRLEGHKFRRQHPLPPYVLDFYCSRARLVVEVDGSQHRQALDAARTTFLERQGLKVVRFWDNEVLGNTSAVLEAILEAVEGRTLTPTPLPGGEGLSTTE